MVNTRPPMAGSDDDDSRRTDLYACPFLKADPAVWVYNRKCLPYRNAAVKVTVLRHHVLDAHQKWNAGFSPDDLRHVNPQLFQDIKDWLAENSGKHDDHSVWMHVYGMIRGDTGDEGVTHPDPYWSLPWLHRIFGRLVRDNVEISPTGDAALDGAIEKLQHVQSMVSNATQELASRMEYLGEIENQVHSLSQYLRNMKQIPPSYQSSFASTQITDNQGTEAAGMLFEEQHNQTAPDMDVDMSVLAERAGESQQEFSIRPWASNAPARDYGMLDRMGRSFLPIQNTGNAPTSYTSNRTTSVATPSSSSMCRSSQFFSE